MHLQKLPDGSIRLSRLNPWDVQTFRSLPALADYTAAPEAERRLLPTPAIESDLTPEMAMDWVEYVVPELRESFAESFTTVLADLETLSPDPGPAAYEAGDGEDSDEDEEEGNPGSSGQASGAQETPQPNASQQAVEEVPEPSMPHFVLTIPADHAEAWFRAMNQARIVLSIRYGIDSERVPELGRLLEAGQLEYWFQYELFVSLQGWLVEAVLNPE
ncbi:MAG: hypothetical protein V4675_01430 [Verrucomicrobiota bacterium]